MSQICQMLCCLFGLFCNWRSKFRARDGFDIWGIHWFINRFRISSWRGYYQHFYRENGVMSLGAKRQLSELYNCSIYKIEKNCLAHYVSQSMLLCILNYVSQRHIELHMIPPLNPHFGELWAAAASIVI